MTVLFVTSATSCRVRIHDEDEIPRFIAELLTGIVQGAAVIYLAHSYKSAVCFGYRINFKTLLLVSWPNPCSYGSRTDFTSSDIGKQDENFPLHLEEKCALNTIFFMELTDHRF